MRRSRPLLAAAPAALALALLVGCSPAESPTTEPEATTVEVEDNFGTQTVPLPARSVVATDNRTFQTLYDWGIPLSAAPRLLMPDSLPYSSDESIINLGNHNEPDLEAVVAADPDLIINGQRFAQYRTDFESLVPEATIVELDPREGEPLDAELKRQTTVLGEVFGKQAEAEALTNEMDTSVARVNEAYDADLTVMALNASGGELSYVAPSNGRALGPVFDIFGLTPAIEIDGSDFHEGDDISVEAIADANPDWILVIDRDAAVGSSEADFQPAAEIIENSEALANVTAIREGNVVFMPNDAYVNEGIQTYTTFFNSFADALGGAGR